MNIVHLALAISITTAIFASDEQNDSPDYNEVNVDATGAQNFSPGTPTEGTPLDSLVQKVATLRQSMVGKSQEDKDKIAKSIWGLIVASFKDKIIE